MAEKTFVAIDRDAALATLAGERRAICRSRPTPETLARYDFAIFALQELLAIPAVPLSEYQALQERLNELEGARIICETAEPE